MARTRKQQQTPSSPALGFATLSPIAAAVAVVFFGADAAQAQSAPGAPQAGGDSSQTVVITGIRRSIETSVTTKREADGIVEAISAEDIGKLPDLSIAESLARVPGLAGQRVGGRVQGIQIRGLSSDFAGTLLNGREQVTTGDNRGVEFDQFPSELINGVTIYKSSDASLIGQGLSGTVDMQSIRPLSMRGRNKLNLNARLEKNSNGALNAGSSDSGKRFSASYVDQFANNTIGVALGIAHLDSPGQELHYKAWGFGRLNADCTANPSWGCSQASGVPTGATVQNGFEAAAVSRVQKRDGAMAVLEYKPNNRLHSTVDLYYSKFKKDETMRGLMGGLAEGWSGNPGVAYTNVGTTTIGSTMLVTSAELANTNLIVRNDSNTRDDELKSFGWNIKAKLGERWTGIADVSHSVAERSENVIETYAGARQPNATPPPATLKTYGTARLAIDPNGGFPRFVPGLDYADARNIYLSDPGSWGHDGLSKRPKAKDELKALRLEGQRDLDGLLNRVSVGFNYAVRRKEREMNEVKLELPGSRAPALVPSQYLRSPTSLSFVGIPGVLAYDVPAMLNGGFYTLQPQALNEVINRNYEVEEKVSTSFVKVDFDGKLWAVPVRGNFGLQVVRTDQSSRGFVRFGNVTPTNPAVETTRGTTYTDFLPSGNLVFDIGASQYLRVAAGMTMARGRMDDMRAGASTSINPTTRLWSGEGGNPQLEPWRAKSLDLSYEKYFGRRSYVALAGFYKELDSYIYNLRTEMDFTGIPNTTGIVPASPIGLFTRPQNGQGGRVTGVEVSTSLEGALLSSALDGFGLIASASYTESNIQPNGPGTDVRLPGLSGTLAGLTLYYEKAGFSARISNRYRSAFRGEITGLHNAREFRHVLADKQTDLQLGYEFGSGPMKGLSVLLQVNNLTDSPYSTRQGSGLTGDVIAPEEHKKFGRQMLLGVNYKL